MGEGNGNNPQEAIYYEKGIEMSGRRDVPPDY